MKIEKQVLLARAEKELENVNLNIEAVSELLESAQYRLEKTEDYYERLTITDEICFWEDRMKLYDSKKEVLIKRIRKYNGNK